MGPVHRKGPTRREQFGQRCGDKACEEADRDGSEAKGHGRLLAATGGWKRHARILPYRLQRAHGPGTTLVRVFWPPELRQYMAVVLSPLMCARCHT